MVPVYLQLQGVLFVWLMVCVYGDYTIVIRVHNYSNPTHTGQSRGPDRCCDGNMGSSNGCDDPQWQKCDNRFTFCLREFDDLTNGISSCVGDVLVSLESEINFHDAPINFTASRWLGLDNPLRLNGLSRAWQGAQTYIEVHDYDKNSNSGIISYQLVDLWVLDGQSSAFVAGADFSPPTMYEGYFGFGSLEMSFRLECSPGYTGDDCSVDIDECLLMDPVPCSGRGNCFHGINYFNCSCDPGYTGERCEVDIDECVGQDCSENGECLDGINSYSCSCNPGFTGMDCSVDIDECLLVDPVPCSGRGNCSHGINYFNCSCDPGYTGERCEVDIDECAVVNCSGNGECVDGVNSFNCQCVSGFTGELCSVEEQGSVPSGQMTAALAGGVVGGLLGLLLIILLLVFVIAILSKRFAQSEKYEVDVVVSNDNNMDNPVYGVCDDVNTANPPPATADPPGYDFDNPLYDVSEPLPLPVEPPPPQDAAVYECIQDNVTNGGYVNIRERGNGLTTDEQTNNLYDVI